MVPSGIPELARNYPMVLPLNPASNESNVWKFDIQTAILDGRTPSNKPLPKWSRFTSTVSHAIQRTRHIDTMRSKTSTSFGDNVSPSVAVVHAIAEVQNVDPVALDTELYDYVDPDALDGLFGERADRQLTVEFDVEAYTVTVRSDRTVTIRTNKPEIAAESGQTRATEGH